MVKRLPGVGTLMLFSLKKNKAQTYFHLFSLYPSPSLLQVRQKGPRFRNQSVEENSSTEGTADYSWDLISKAVLTFGYSADPAGRSQPPVEDAGCAAPLQSTYQKMLVAGLSCSHTAPRLCPVHSRSAGPVREEKNCCLLLFFWGNVF